MVFPKKLAQKIAKISQEKIEKIIPLMVSDGIGTEKEIRESIAEAKKLHTLYQYDKILKEADEVIKIIN